MKQKIFLLLISAFFIAGSFAQATVNVFINGTLAGQISVMADQTAAANLSYKKSVYKKIDKLSVQIQGKSVDGGYFRKLIVMGDDNTPLLIADETVGVVGQFILTDNGIIKRLKKGKAISLYVEKTPANTKSNEAVKRVYVGTLTREK